MLAAVELPIVADEVLTGSTKLVFNPANVTGTEEGNEVCSYGYDLPWPVTVTEAWELSDTKEMLASCIRLPS